MASCYKKSVKISSNFIHQSHSGLELGMDRWLYRLTKEQINRQMDRVTYSDERKYNVERTDWCTDSL